MDFDNNSMWHQDHWGSGSRCFCSSLLRHFRPGICWNPARHSWTVCPLSAQSFKRNLHRTRLRPENVRSDDLINCWGLLLNMGSMIGFKQDDQGFQKFLALSSIAAIARTVLPAPLSSTSQSPAGSGNAGDASQRRSAGRWGRIPWHSPSVGSGMRPVSDSSHLMRCFWWSHWLSGTMVRNESGTL